VFVNGQVSEKGFHCWYAHLLGMSLVVEEDEALDPGDVSLFCADGIVFAVNGVTRWSRSFLGRSWGY